MPISSQSEQCLPTSPRAQAIKAPGECCAESRAAQNRKEVAMGSSSSWKRTSVVGRAVSRGQPTGRATATLAPLLSLELLLLELLPSGVRPPSMVCCDEEHVQRTATARKKKRPSIQALNRKCGEEVLVMPHEFPTEFALKME